MHRSINFDSLLEKESQANTEARDARFQLEKNLDELSHLKKISADKRRELNELQHTAQTFKESNRQLRVSMMKTLIDKEELSVRRTSLCSVIENLRHKRDELEKVSNIMLESSDSDAVCQRFSIKAQMETIKKLQDARNKLVKSGFPASTLD